MFSYVDRVYFWSVYAYISEPPLPRQYVTERLLNSKGFLLEGVAHILLVSFICAKKKTLEVSFFKLCSDQIQYSPLL